MREKGVTFHDAASATATGTTLNVAGFVSLLAQITGTFSASVTWQGTAISQSDTVTWVAIPAVNLTTSAVATTATAAGLYTLNVAGMRQVRANLTWTSGTSITVLVKAVDGTTPLLTQAMQLIDENGAAYGVKHVSNKVRTSAMPYPYDIAEGNVPNHMAMRALGYNQDVDNVREDLWEVGGTYVFPTAAMQMELVSTSDQDSGAGGVNPAGTGVQSVDIAYLDANYAEQNETVVLDGTTVVTTTATNILRVQSMHTQTAGTGLFAAGVIDLRHLANTPIYGRIIVGENTSLRAIWTVPAGYTLFVVGWHAGIGNSTGNRFGQFLLLSTSTLEGVLTAGIFNTKDIVAIQDNSTYIPFSMPLKVPATADIKISTISDNAAANALCAGGFEGWYEA